MRIFGIFFIFFAASNLPSGQSLRTVDKAKTVAEHVVEHVVEHVIADVEKVVVSTALKNCDAVKVLYGITSDILHGSYNDPDVTKLTLDFYTKSGEVGKINIRDAPNTLLNSPHFSSKKPIVIFLHGFLKNSDSSAAKTITNSILSQWDVNVLVVDSSSILSLVYAKSSACVSFIGTELGEMLTALLKRGGINPAKVHIIGHGLGAHMAGFCGKAFNDHNRKKIGRITGLDPAGPCFFHEKKDFKLKESDADFVDVIHTDAGVLGIAEPLGHVDFYPNLGENQPGCTTLPCSHNRAWEIYSASVKALHGFPAVKCASKDAFISGSCDKNENAYMGFAVDKYARGTYYLKTTDKHPFTLRRVSIGAMVIKELLNLF